MPRAQARWDFVVLSGTVPGTTRDGASWDAFGGLPDPYVCVSIFSAPDDCAVWANNTSTPVWNAKVWTNVTSDEIGFQHWELWDDDGIGDDVMGGCHAEFETEGWTLEQLYSGNVMTFTCTQAKGYVPDSPDWHGEWTVRFQINYVGG